MLFLHFQLSLVWRLQREVFSISAISFWTVSENGCLTYTNLEVKVQDGNHVCTLRETLQVSKTKIKKWRFWGFSMVSKYRKMFKLVPSSPSSSNQWQNFCHLTIALTETCQEKERMCRNCVLSRKVQRKGSIVVSLY